MDYGEPHQPRRKNTTDSSENINIQASNTGLGDVRHVRDTVNLSISTQRMRCSMKLISKPRSLNLGARKILTVTTLAPACWLATWKERESDVSWTYMFIIDS